MVDGYLHPDNQDLVSDIKFINQNNCPSSNGTLFGNCAPDQYCIEHGQNCNGTCIWLV